VTVLTNMIKNEGTNDDIFEILYIRSDGVPLIIFLLITFIIHLSFSKKYEHIDVTTVRLYFETLGKR
jgi:hypothetical protein